MKKYRFGFDIYGLIIFLIIMIPNIIWFAVPSVNDILRSESITSIIDAVGSVFQVLMIASLCFLIRRDADKLKFKWTIFAMIMSVVVYYWGWGLYYYGIVNASVIVLLTIPPCFAFILYALDRKNYVALTSALGFMGCHLVYGLVNFII